MPRLQEAEQRQNVSPWIFGSLIAFVLAMLIGMFVFIPFDGSPKVNQFPSVDINKMPSVHFARHLWVPRGKPVSIPDALTGSVGRSDEGYFVYAVKRGGGGGVGMPKDSYVLFLRLSYGIYQPLIRS